MILSCPNCATKFKVNPNAIPPEGRTVKCAKCSHKWHADPEADAVAEQGAGTAAASPAPAVAAAAAAPAAETVAPPPPPPPPAPEPEPEPEPAPPPPPPPAASPEPEAPAAEDAPMEEDTPPPPPPEPHLEIGDDLPPIPPEGFQPQSTAPVESNGPLIAWAALGFFILVFGIVGYFFRFGLVESYPPLSKVYNVLGIEVAILGNGLTLPDPVVDREEKGNEITLVISGTITNVTDESIVIPILKGSLLNTQGEAIHVWVFNASTTEALPAESVKYETRVVNPPPGAVNLALDFITDEESHMLENEKMPMGEDGSKTEESDS